TAATTSCGLSGLSSEHGQGEAVMARLLLVSSDGHIGAPLSSFRDYIDPMYRAAYDEWLAAHRQKVDDLRRTGIATAAMPGRRRPFVSEDPEHGVTVAEICDPQARTATIEGEGAVAEVLFPGPDFARELGFPFGPLGDLTPGTSPLFNAD